MPDQPMDENEQPADRYNRVFGQEIDETGMELCRALFPRIDEAERQINGIYVNVIEDRSSLRLDDRYLGAWRGGGLARSALNAGLDSLMTVKLILEQGVIPMTALYPLLRAAMENASLALYLLAPKERDERLRRSYVVADDDARNRGTYETERGLPDVQAKRDEIRAELRGLISARPSLGDPSTFPFPRVQYSDLVAEAAAVIDADPAIDVERDMPLLAWWQVQSGLSHGKQWAFLEVLERSQAIVDEENQSATVRMTTSPGVVAVILERAIHVLEAALRVYGQRSKAAWNQPEDAEEPDPVPFSQLGP